MLLLGIDIGTSSIKVSVIDADTRRCIAATRYPDNHENDITAKSPGWAEQDPGLWWEQTKLAIRKLTVSGTFNASAIGAIGIAYQMHGLVVVDEDGNALRDSIIWCDSRAVAIGDAAFSAIGGSHALKHLLNSPGNFTASKWAWVKNNEPDIYSRAHRIMLPGDYIALQLTGQATTTISALSEGIFWDFRTNQLSSDIMNYFGFDKRVIPDIAPLFGTHGTLTPGNAAELGLRAGIPITYKAGDQPNNALSLNVLRDGEVAATAGTSGVIYAVSNQLIYDRESRVNTFAHVNYTPEDPHTGILLCINGTGILNRWVKTQLGSGLTYDQMTAMASAIDPGSNGLSILPFGNGAERMLHNQIIGAQFMGLDFNTHRQAHIFRAAQEGIAYAFRYGLDVLRENGLSPAVIRAGHSNLFLSELLSRIFVEVTQTPVELYDNDGSVGAAIGAGIGAGVFQTAGEAFEGIVPLKTIEPAQTGEYEPLYQAWKQQLDSRLKQR